MHSVQVDLLTYLKSCT